MSKRSLFIVIGIIVLLTGGLIYFSLRKTSLPDDQTRFRPIPMNAAIIIESHNVPALLDGFLKDNRIKRELSNIPSFNAFYKLLQRTDSLIRGDASLGKVLSGGSVIVSFHVTGKNTYDALFTLSFGNSSEAEQVISYLRQKVEPQSTAAATPYNGVDLHRKDILLPSGEKRALVFGQADQFVVGSLNRMLVEESVRQIPTGTSLLDQPGFRTIYATSGKNVQANVYLNHQQLPRLFGLMAHPDVQGPVEKLRAYGDWTELDLSIRSEEILLSGFTYANDSSTWFLNALAKQSPQAMSLENILPAHTHMFAAFSLSDLPKFRTRHKQYLETTGLLPNRKTQLESLNQELIPDAENLLFSLIDKEFGLAILPGSGQDTSLNHLLILKTRSQAEAMEMLLPIVKKSAEAKNPRNPGLKPFDLDKETKVEVGRFPIPDLGSKLLGAFFGNTRSDFFAFIDNYLVFGPSQEILVDIARDNMLKRTLALNPDYLLVKEKFAGKSNFYLYSAFGPSLPFLSSLLNTNLTKNLKQNTSHLSKFQCLAIQIRYSGKPNLFATDLFLFYNPPSLEKPRTVWQSQLDTSIALKPKFVINHQNQEKEIVVQDQNHTLYLINSSGRILWQKKLDGPVLSEISQIDALKNGKLQLIFNTRNAIYLIDRNGDDLVNFPIKLPSTASSGLSVFDYEKNRDYRIFVPLTDKRVLLFNKEGRQIRDWAFSKAEHPVISEIQHFRIGDKDFIVFSDKNRTYFLDRKGNQRFKPERSIPRYPRNPIFAEQTKGAKSSEAFFILADSTGMVYRLALTGKIETRKFETGGKTNWFDYQDVNGDGKKDYIFSGQREIMVFESDGKNILKHTSNGEISFRPAYYLFPGNKAKLGYVIGSSNQLILINSDGSLYEGFPLTGESQFSIGVINDPSRFNLIVGGKSGLLYNYGVRF